MIQPRRRLMHEPDRGASGVLLIVHFIAWPFVATFDDSQASQPGLL